MPECNAPLFLLPFAYFWLTSTNMLKQLWSERRLNVLNNLFGSLKNAGIVRIMNMKQLITVQKKKEHTHEINIVLTYLIS